MSNKSIINYNKQELEGYLNDLKLVGELSGLYSNSNVPFLHYRATENIYCTAFDADNLARADITADARLRKYGVGIKTFVEGTKHTYQKIAEFNNQNVLYRDLKPVDKVKKVAELRNIRMDFTRNVYGIERLIYHCIVRNSQGFALFEENMYDIDLNNIKLTTSKDHIFEFTDGKENYKFNESKSTLYKQFNTEDACFASVEVEILDDPLSLLRKLNPSSFLKTEVSEFLFLPLYSTNRTKKFVSEKSGLNQWNAGGRKRNANEVYIPYPAEIRSVFDGYFPNRDTPFDVELPNGKIISMKICQDGGKAIMSNPNKSLGEWLLRDVLKLQEGELLTYEKLLAIGVDSIVFEKVNGKYKIDFGKIGLVEEFYETNILADYG